MNAIKFIQDNGVEKAREVVEGAPTGTNHYCADNYWFWDGITLRRTAGDGFFIHSIWGASEEWVSKAVSLPDLKRLVESVDLINANGGLNGTKNTITLFQSSLDLGLYHGVDGVDAEVEIPRLKQAIADYQAIYSNDIKIEVSFGISLMPSERLACIDLTPRLVIDCETLDHPEDYTSPNCKKFDERVNSND